MSNQLTNTMSHLYSFVNLGNKVYWTSSNTERYRATLSALHYSYVEATFPKTLPQV